MVHEKCKVNVSISWDSYATATLADAANKFNYSQAYLLKMIKKLAGKNFSDLVRKQKMRHACAMLKNSEITMDFIAETTGYADASHFSCVFKSVYGISPGEYGKKGGI